MIKNKYMFAFWLALTIIFMFVIFHGSNTPYQQQDIKPFLRGHIEIPNLPHISFRYDGSLVTTEQPYAFVEFFIRKAGHITEYAVLTFLLVNTLLSTALARKLSYSIGFITAFLFAGSDEWHQSFVPDRTGHLIDVVTFDLSGILLGILAVWVFKLILKKRA
ncbi:VanZ like protein [Scopulibacillus darangshiensis]|uniref:VanZ like protein n=1 Tax=Scopulibacillus darangshiensis TaxID=442528 RepID=A0A4R2NWJ1_9BACL|nr:VanZ family protein [Scopulibacillus darangshiensis]TCP25988.1 VanZ like protein [Scopulibacillus darangshiensis]